VRFCSELKLLGGLDTAKKSFHPELAIRNYLKKELFVITLPTVLSNGLHVVNTLPFYMKTKRSLHPKG
jgi:hypothetical protein